MEIYFVSLGQNLHKKLSEKVTNLRRKKNVV